MARTKMLTIVLIACLVVVLGYTAADLNRQSQKRNGLNEQITTGRSILAVLPTPQTDAAGRLAKAQTDYETALNGVSLTAAPTDIIKSLLALTDRFNFKVNPITTEQWAKRSVGTAIYRFLPINFSLEGKFLDIDRFLAALEDEKQYPSLEIENTQIVPLDQTSPDSPQYDARLQIRISIIERLSGNE